MFEPKGDRSLRVVVTEMASKAEHGELLSFAVLAEAVGALDDKAGRAQVRQVVSAARPLLLADYGRALVPVRGKGYRVARPGELAGVAQDYRRRGDRQIQKALTVIDQADRTAMSSEELLRFRAVGAAIHGLHRRMVSAEDRITDLEEALFGSPKAVVQGTVEQG